MDTQFAEEEGVIEMLLMSTGRLFFKVGEKDNWQFMPYLIGTSQTGKSTLLNIVKKMFNNIGVINQNFEEKFGLSGLYSKEVVICDDLPEDMRQVFPQETFQTCISGGTVSIAMKNVTAKEIQWVTPFIFAGNWHFNYKDTTNQISRRIIIFEFINVVRKGDPTIEKRIIQDELPAVIYKCLMTYKTFLEKYGCQLLEEFLPPYFKQTFDDMKRTNNPLYRFLCDMKESGRLKYEANAITNVSSIKGTFESQFNLRTGNKRLDIGTILQMNSRFENGINQISVEVVCKFQGKVAVINMTPAIEQEGHGASRICLFPE